MRLTYAGVTPRNAATSACDWPRAWRSSRMRVPHDAAVGVAIRTRDSVEATGRRRPAETGLRGVWRLTATPPTYRTHRPLSAEATAEAPGCPSEGFEGRSRR